MDVLVLENFSVETLMSPITLYTCFAGEGCALN